MKKSSLVIALIALCPLALAADPTIRADRQNVDAACVQDAATAGCAQDKVGTGLLKCLGAYKRANRKTFHFSPGCKAAMEQLHMDKKAGK